jgi:hypothetical protein
LGNGTQFHATMEDCTSAKTTLNGTALNWVSGDQIAVYGTAGCGIYSATLQTPAISTDFVNANGETGNAPFRAFYPTTLTTDGVNITLPSTQTYVDGSIHEFPMYAESNDNQLSFKNLCGVLKLHLTKANTSISTITITAASETMINGTFSVSYNHTTNVPALAYSANGTNTTTLTCATPQSIAGDGKDFYIYLPEGSYSGLQIQMNTDDNRYCVKTANIAINVTRSQYTLITLGENNLTFRPVGSKGGLFTINGDGDQVWFSQGNLLYQASTNIWRFADHQYIANENSWQDKFCWGTGNNPTSHTGNSSDYTSFVDWGENAIANGGNQANMWRTWTSAEWDYIFNHRTNASSKYGTGNVDGHSGMILLPDNFTLPSGCTFNSGMASSPNDWTRNSYTISQWSKMEAAGAVFLANNDTQYGPVYQVYGGCYWGSDSYNETRGHSLWFDGNWLNINDNSEYQYSFGVRLVWDNN